MAPADEKSESERREGKRGWRRRRAGSPVGMAARVWRRAHINPSRAYIGSREQGFCLRRPEMPLQTLMWSGLGLLCVLAQYFDLVPFIIFLLFNEFPIKENWLNKYLMRFLFSKKLIRSLLIFILLHKNTVIFGILLGYYFSASLAWRNVLIAFHGIINQLISFFWKNQPAGAWWAPAWCFTLVEIHCGMYAIGMKKYVATVVQQLVRIIGYKLHCLKHSASGVVLS